MNKANLLLANFDARISKIKILPKNIHTKVILKSKMYDENIDQEVIVKIKFIDVAAIDFRINYCNGMIGAEAFGLYEINDESFIKSVFEANFKQRKEIYLLEGHYDYDETDSSDMLNCNELNDRIKKDMNQYKAYIQNVDAGVYIIIAKDIEVSK